MQYSFKKIMFTTEKDSNLCDIGALHPLWTTHSYIFRQVEATPGCGLTSWQIEIRISWSSNFNHPFSILVSWTHNDSTCKEYGKNSLFAWKNGLKSQMPHKFSPKSCIMTKNSTDVLGFSSSFSRSCRTCSWKFARRISGQVTSL